MSIARMRLFSWELHLLEKSFEDVKNEQTKNEYVACAIYSIIVMNTLQFIASYMKISALRAMMTVSQHTRAMARDSPDKVRGCAFLEINHFSPYSYLKLHTRFTTDYAITILCYDIRKDTMMKILSCVPSKRRDLCLSSKFMHRNDALEQISLIALFDNARKYKHNIDETMAICWRIVIHVYEAILPACWCCYIPTLQIIANEIPLGMIINPLDLWHNPEKYFIMDEMINEEEIQQVMDALEKIVHHWNKSVPIDIQGAFRDRARAERNLNILRFCIERLKIPSDRFTSKIIMRGETHLARYLSQYPCDGDLSQTFVSRAIECAAQIECARILGFEPIFDSDGICRGTWQHIQRT